MQERDLGGRYEYCMRVDGDSILERTGELGLCV
jgi:hypothetical protein